MSMQAILTAKIDAMPWIQRQRGFTLLEALVSIAVLGFGFVTTMAFHGDLLGSAGENRIRSTAMSLAEARLEALRAQPFDTLSAGSFEDTIQLQGFGFLSLRPVTLKRCWAIADETELKRVQVAVSRADDDCSPWGEATLVTLSSRIANNNFARAGVLTLGDSLFNPDGFGELVPATDERIGDGYDPLSSLPGGFEVRDFDLPGDNDGFAMCDAGVCLVPNVDAEGNQNFATINGNIFLSGRTCTTVGDGTLADRCGIELVIEGNGLCRLHYPDEGNAPPALPAATGVDSFNYIRYSCVVADQWRRSISLLPEETEKVCVGNPALILADGDPSDQLRSITRFYDGRRNAAFDAEDNLVEENPHGLKGGPLTGDLQAIIGTMCTSDDDCWDDTSSRGLVPGGHHFLVMPTAGGSCSSRMEQLADVDTENNTYYANLFVRNPDIFFCTSAKDYEGDFCTTFTRSSGFIANESDQSLVADDLVILPRGSGLLQACGFFGGLGDDGGGYVCGLRHDVAQAEITGVPLNDLLVFADPDSHVFDGADDYLPITFPIDATARNFSVVDANRPPTVTINEPSCTELLCSFSGSAIDEDGTIDPESYGWSFGDGTTATGTAVTHTYLAAGTYTVTFGAADNDGAWGFASTSVTLTSEGANNAPEAGFTSDCTELSCLFVSTSTDNDPLGSIVSWTWDFGEGTSISSGDTVTHDYAANGDYTVTLTVTDDQGAPASTTQVVTVEATVVEVKCDIAVTGIKQSNNAVVAMSYNGGPFLTCADVGQNGYQCMRTNALEGAPVELRSTRSGNHPVLGHDFTVDCNTPSFNHNFN